MRFQDDAAASVHNDAVVEALQVENAALRPEHALIGRLKKRSATFGLNNSNSGKPPSSDRLRKLCNVHHQRELRTLLEIEKRDWVGKMGRLLRRA